MKTCKHCGFQWSNEYSSMTWEDFCPSCHKFIKTYIHNLTPHEINIITEDKTINIKSEGIARCTTKREKVSDIGIIPIYKTSFGEVEGLPEPKENHVYIVSALVAQACSGRTDLLVPDDTVRNAQGKIIGCRGLARV